MSADYAMTSAPEPSPEQPEPAGTTGAKGYALLFGIGMLLEDDFQFSDRIILRPVKLDSDIERLKARTSSQREYGFVCALAEAVTFEVEISGEIGKELAAAGWNAQWILILISIYIRSPLYWPLNGFRIDQEDEDFQIRVGNLFFGNSIFSEPVSASIPTLQKCAANFAAFGGLMSDARFSHAASVAATNYNEPRATTRVAAIWSAIESLLGFDYELKFRISAAIARLLESQEDSRYLRFINVQKLYDFRSKCVHGAEIKDKDRIAKTSESLNLLCELLIFFIERGSMIDKAEMNRIFLQ